MIPFLYKFVSVLFIISINSHILKFEQTHRDKKPQGKLLMSFQTPTFFLTFQDYTTSRQPCGLQRSSNIPSFPYYILIICVSSQSLAAICEKYEEKVKFLLQGAVNIRNKKKCRKWWKQRRTLSKWWITLVYSASCRFLVKTEKWEKTFWEESVVSSAHQHKEF